LSAVKESLIERITDEVQALPEDLKQQVLDFAGYLRARYLSARNAERDQALAATFGSWQDEREPEQIIQDIYAQRTISDSRFEL
jgi:lauroyl/myristoyl acyltransferase